MSVAADEGFVTAEWAAGIALLVVPVLLLVGVLPTWAARQEGATAAAREATRVVAQTQDPAAAGPAAAAALADRGLAAASVEVVVPTDPAGRTSRAGTVQVRVTVAGEPLTLPGFGLVHLPGVTGHHARVLDPLRSR